MNYILVIFLSTPIILIDATRISGANDTVTGSWNMTDIDILRAQLLAGYDSRARPSEHNNVTPVTLSLRIQTVDVSEATSTVAMYGWLKVRWNDPKMRWTPSKHNNIDSVHMFSYEIWVPDVVLYNGILKDTDIISPYMIAYPDGTVLYVPSVSYEIKCRLNYKYWPRDTQVCRFIFGSWTYHEFALNLTFEGSGIDNETTGNIPLQEGQWHVKSVKTERQSNTYPCCKEPYPALIYEITFQRLAKVNAIIQEAVAASLCMLLLISACRPPNSRLFLLATVALLSVFYVAVLTYDLPFMNDNPPRIVIFLLGILGVSVFWSLSSVIIDSLGKDGRPVPSSLKRFVKKAKVNSRADEELKLNEDVNSKSTTTLNNNESSHDWSKLGVLFDRISLLIGFVVLLTLLVLSF